MNIYSEKLWENLSNLSKKSQFRRAAISYVSSDEDLEFLEGDLLIVNASDHVIESGGTSADLLEKLLKKGVILYSNSTLHTKLIIFDEYIYIGSANISKNSKENLIEAGVLFSYVDQPHLLNKSQEILISIQNDKKTILLDGDEVSRLKALPVKQKMVVSRERFKQTELVKKYWALGTYEKDYKGDYEQIEAQSQTLVNDNNSVDWFFIKERHAKQLFQNCEVGHSVTLFKREQRNDFIKYIELVSILHISTDEQNNKIYFYKSLSTFCVNEKREFLESKLAKTYATKWIGRELYKNEVKEIKENLLSSF